MTDIQTEPQAPQPLESIMRRVSMPLLLFAAALFGLLLASRLFLLPRFTNFTIAGQVLNPADTAAYEKKLEVQLKEMEDHRLALALPVADETYDLLKIVQKDQPHAAALRSQLQQVAARAGVEQSQFVLHALRVDAAGRRVRATGDIRNAGTRSMTLLAAFVDELAGEPEFTDIVRPSFTRTNDAAAGMLSPFTIEFTVTRTGMSALQQ